jgi:hypothetical protein
MLDSISWNQGPLPLPLPECNPAINADPYFTLLSPSQSVTIILEYVDAQQASRE